MFVSEGTEELFLEREQESRSLKLKYDGRNLGFGSVKPSQEKLGIPATMYSGYGGSPSRTLSTMSLSVRPIRCLASKPVTRSQSFTGVNTFEKTYRNLPALSTPGLRRKPSRASRMFTISPKSNPTPKVPQPERLDEVYAALKNGLQDYLQVYQLDLDSFSKQMKGSKRNSRLGFLYELDKQVKVTERHIRRLEFHLSRIEELYEAYCLQWRLRDGANKMVKAYTDSSGSKEARESLAEANKGYKEYTENMCILENELENQLGEFHIRMKGLAGFARLCAGDQYEIFMRYGRQRWKLRGKVELNAKQVWDSEEMVFLPLINEFLSVKVTELKTLANHVVVGNVSCETKDLFAALPQTVALDINDLGTIKLSLEVKWIPFDKDDQGPVATTVNKAVSKRFSAIFNQSPPDTPSLREQAFYNLLRRQEESENGIAWSISSESSDDLSSPRLSVGGLCNSTNHKAMLTPEIQPAGTGTSLTQSDISLCLRDSSHLSLDATLDINSEVSDLSKKHSTSTREKDNGTVTSVTKKENDERQQTPIATPDEVMSCHTSRICSRSLSHISESSADGTVMTDKPAGKLEEVMHLDSGLSVKDTELKLPCTTPELPSSADTLNDSSSKMVFVSNQNTSDDSAKVHHTNGKIQDEVSLTLTPCRHGCVDSDSSSQVQTNTYSHMDSGEINHEARRVSVDNVVQGAGANEHDSPMDSELEEALGNVVSSLDDYRGQFPELQPLEHELKMLMVTLKGRKQSSSLSMVSLTVETALGSFDFLNTSDLEEEEEENTHKSGNVSSLQERCLDNTSSSPAPPITTGCPSLDCALVAHLKNCSSQLLHLGTHGPLRCREIYALDRLLREIRVFEIIRNLTKDNPKCPRQPSEVIPQLGQCHGAVSLWQQCVGQESAYSVSAESFLFTLASVYSNKATKRDNIADTVFSCLVERMLDQRLPLRGSRDNPVTVFHLWTYLEANDIRDMETHICDLAEEVWLVQNLASSDQDVIVHALRHCVECRLKREGLQAVAKLLKDQRGKVSALASSVLRGLATQPRQREQALVSCLELLESQDTDVRICGCKALACLKAEESIDQLVYLCGTDKEEVRNAAKQTLLVLGEEGRMAHRHVETSQKTIQRLFAPGSMASTAF